MVASRVAGTIPILLAVCLLNLRALARYNGGSGTADDPYQIATAEDLMLLGETPEDYDKHFVLTADIDLDPNLPGRKVFDRAVIAPDTDPAPNQYGYNAYGGTAFTGVFDGNDHWISHLTIMGTGYWGLFGKLDTGAEVKNLGVVDVNITGSGFIVGGLVGDNYGNVTNCHSTGAVDGEQQVGGLVGVNGGNVTWCYNTSAVSCAGSIAGGLVGMNWGNVSTCYSTGEVIGTKWDIGGLVGENSDGGTVTNCYSTGSAHGEDSVGGLVGQNHQSSSVTNCYSTGAVSGTGSSVGGLVGSNISVVIRCFWDTQTSGQVTSAGATGKTTGTMQMAGTFQDAGWDFVGETQNGTHEVWQMPEGSGYPVLAIFNGYTPPRLQGTGTREEPYLVSDAIELGAILHYSSDAHYRLTHTIDLSDIHWAMAIVPWFGGTFDGNNYAIINLNIDGGTHLGLFGRLESHAEISDLGIVDTSIVGSGSYIGGLAGINEGIITHCYSTGTVISTENYIGGLIGSNSGNVAQCYSTGVVKGSGYVGGLLGGNNWGTVTTCYSTGAVSGDDYIGGLVGDNAVGNVSRCYSMTSVTGNYAMGGLVGSNERAGATRAPRGDVSQCYSTGSVRGNSAVGGLVGIGDWGEIERITQCFWDIETSSQPESAGGTGKTTAEMQMAATFLEAGWDFVGEALNGPNDFWRIWDGYDYPRLAWEAGPSTPLVFVDVNDPGFCGRMSRYEVTNAQYCDFLNAALASSDITVNGTKVEGASGSNSGEDYAGLLYYNGGGSGYTGYGATNGGAARIRYDAGAFGVDDGFGNHPVTYVSWYGAMAFANYYGYYLPAEDQWQAVADYDGTYIYGCGQTIDPGIANYRVSQHPDGTMPVGTFGAYGYGMSDMAGNVWEWTISSLDSNRVFRGGSMGSVESDCAVSIRGDGIPHAAYFDTGFRVCR